MGAERLLDLLRGRKGVFYLIEGCTKLCNPSLYPYKTDEVPIQCLLSGTTLSGSLAYRSGDRSIVQPSGDGRWFKAKAIGIPTQFSAPLYMEGKIYSYFLSDATIGSGQVIWGFSTVDEAEDEIARLTELRALGLPAPEPIGIGCYPNVYVMDLKDRSSLISLLETTTRDALLRRFTEQSRLVEAACMFMVQPTDVRVDEILHGFLHPSIDQVLDPRDIKDFLAWMGSSCGLNLRMHHDAGVLHGTEYKDAKRGYMTQSHLANHLVDEKSTYMADYHMASKSKDQRLMELELFLLAEAMNPLPKAEEAASKVFETPQVPLEHVIPESPQGGFNPLGSVAYLENQLFMPKTPQEDFTKALLKGLEYGYKRRKIQHIELQIRREILLVAATAKKELFQLLGFPEGIQRAKKGYVQASLEKQNLNTEEVKQSTERLMELTTSDTAPIKRTWFSRVRSLLTR
jgi:hypothetical protein